jgi:hypothetical protein
MTFEEMSCKRNVPEWSLNKLFDKTKKSTTFNHMLIIEVTAVLRQHVSLSCTGFMHHEFSVALFLISELLQTLGATLIN